ncbi:glycosyltransferase family 31 protein [Melanomma pulvis-pyrius CBS 109.77]|uniref:N-acetylgalactosaminide beta-1,3-galactosyltransferase n=1 Tax=Melanomma pulvis-pyrius CBS 109.77 TaxID=1314802 RepID=A0A6A6XRB3_9PLEO|nr:glycosyltransferase family 31 protein [Melanomma pulvis-pyrius CBS 109.77]
MPPRTFLCQLIFCAVFSVSIINVFTSASAPSFFLRYTKPSALPNRDIFCSQSELADDVLVVLRTGATESREKLPVHFRTTLRCVPHFVLFSDMDEEIEGHAVHDVLGGVSEETRKEHKDFNLYSHLRRHGRQGLEGQKVITAQSGSSKGDYLNTDAKGWALDKFKFLPMIDSSIQEMPHAKWYVFIEADTYLNWNNLLEYLSNFDATKPYYIGKHLYINDIEFGYGGAGFVLSNPAMRKVSEHRSVRIREYEDFTANHWVGDCALGKILEDVKVPLHRAFPHFQADSPATMDPATTKIDRNAWCYPAVTYHHVSPSEIEELWRFEQDWYKRHDVLLRHRDIFMEHVRPQIRTSLLEWDNMSADKEYNAHDHGTLADETERNAWKSFRHCHAVCEKKKDCIQFSYESGSCSLSYSFRLGYAKPKEKVQSGWMLDRVDDLFLNLESKCGVRDWFSPQEGAIIHKKR